MSFCQKNVDDNQGDHMWTMSESMDYLFNEERFNFVKDPIKRKKVLLKISKKLNKIKKSSSSKVKLEIKALVVKLKLA